MKKVKIIAGITWAFVCLILILVLFPGLNSFSESASKLSFMKINPNYNGGELARQIVSEGCTLNIRKPVFDGLIGERKNGFVQLDWRGSLPDEFSDTIDYNFDNNPDFRISVDKLNSRTSLDAFDIKVKNVTISTPTSYGWAVRVELIK